MRIAFWNVNKNGKINEYVEELIRDNSIDILVMAEYSDDINRLLDELSQKDIFMLEYFSYGCERIKILGNQKSVKPGYQGNYCSFQIIDSKYILCCVHLPSKLYADEQKQEIVIRSIVEEIENTEEKEGINNTIIVGDMNSNPYEPSCLGAPQFHGIPIYDETCKKERTILGSKFSMFYNPMWNFFGDFSFPAGTYYYSSNDVSIPFWNIYDQVLIRPCLRKVLDERELKIIHKTKQHSLLDEKKHPNKNISDHLPIVFEIKEELE